MNLIQILILLLFQLVVFTSCGGKSGDSAADPVQAGAGSSGGNSGTGNPNPGTPFNVTVNQKSAQLDPTNSLPIEFQVLFEREIDPGSFTNSDISFTGSAAGITFTIIHAGGNQTFFIRVTNVSTPGSLIPIINANTILDPFGNLNLVSTSDDNSVDYTSNVLVTIDQKGAQADPTNTVDVEFDVVFSTAIDPLTFDSSDITQNGTATVTSWTITDSGDQKNFTLKATAVSMDGTILPSLSANTVQTVGLTNNFASTSTDNSVTYDTTVPTVTIDPASVINIANQAAYNLTGTCSENSQIVTVYAGGVQATPTCTSSTWSTTIDVSSEVDNPALSITADHLDLATNPAVQATTAILKDTVAPIVTITVADPINGSNETAYTVEGTCTENGINVSVAVGTLNLTPPCIGGAFTTGNMDVSPQADSPAFPITLDQTDSAGNPATQASTSVDKNTSTPTVTITSAPDITQTNVNDYIVSGTCSENGRLVPVAIGSLNFSPNCSGGTWSTGNVDVASLADSPSILITADHDNVILVPAVQASTNVSKDVTAPTVTISSAPNITLSNELIYIASGTCSEDTRTVDVAIGNLNYSPTCTSGSWTTGQVDVSSLTDGPSILVTADHDNASSVPATQATLNISKSTATPTVSNLSVPATLAFSADLTWTLVDPGGFTLDDYIINYRKQGTSTWLVFNDGVDLLTSKTVTNLLDSTTYEFRVAVAYDSGSQSGWSNIAVGETKVDDPIFNSPYKAMNVGGATSSTVAALEDNTDVTLDGNPLVTLQKGQTHTFVSTQYQVIDANKPIYTAGRRGNIGAGAQYKANVAWNSVAWAGKKFSFNATRFNPQQLYVYAVENADITVKQGNTVLDTLTLTAGQSAPSPMSWSVYGSFQVTSTGLILAYHSSGSGTIVADPKPLLPSFTEIIGFPSNSMRITTDSDGTNYSLIHANSAVASNNLDKTEVIQVNANGGSGAYYQGNSLIISADNNISGASFADSNGYCASPFVPTNIMKKKFIVNVNSDYVAFASKQAGTIEVRDSSDTLIQTLTLTRSGANPNAPYKARRGTTTAGYRFTATVPVAGWYQPNSDTGGADEDETILYGFD